MSNEGHFDFRDLTLQRTNEGFINVIYSLFFVCQWKIVFKANLSQQILVILLKQGIGYVYVTFDFICIG